MMQRALATAKNNVFIVNWSVEHEHLAVLNLVVRQEEASVVNSIFLVILPITLSEINRI